MSIFSEADTAPKYETRIGVEVHVQLNVRRKLFSSSSTTYGEAPNSQASIIDLGLPGTLPVLNREAVSMAARLGLAIGADIAEYSQFARKHYFYPDLPKGYQTTQADHPILSGGHLDITVDKNTKTIRITRAHLEEDAGKSLHLGQTSGIDLNRAGVPLLEIVSEPDLYSAEETVAYLKTLHTLVRYLGICDGNMQEGSFRCDVNISMRRPGEPLGTRAEIKNVNSFRYVEKAIRYEQARQMALLDAGKPVVQETRLYDPARNETRSMRSKEDAHDYRYMPCPDLPLLHVERTWVDEIKEDLPELPWEKRKRFQSDYDLDSYDTDVLIQDADLADFFETLLAEGQDIPPKLAANWVMNELLGALNQLNVGIDGSPISAQQLAQLLTQIESGTLSGKMAKTVFETLLQDSTQTVEAIIQEKGLKQITDTKALKQLVDEVINRHEKEATQYREGKEKLLGFFVGQAIKQSQGKANPQQLNTLFKTKLNPGR